MTKDEAMKLALEALDSASRYGAGGFDDAKDAIREALAEQPALAEQDNTYGYTKRLAEHIFQKFYAQDESYASGDVVWRVSDTTLEVVTQIDNMVCGLVRKAEQPAQQEPDNSNDLTIAYMAGVQRGKELSQRTWVGLTDEERIQFVFHICNLEPYFAYPLDAAVCAIEAKLKEKNA